MNLTSFSGKMYIDPNTYAITKIEVYAVYSVAYNKARERIKNSELVWDFEIKSDYTQNKGDYIIGLAVPLRSTII